MDDTWNTLSHNTCFWCLLFFLGRRKKKERKKGCGFRVLGGPSCGPHCHVGSAVAQSRLSHWFITVQIHDLATPKPNNNYYSILSLNLLFGCCYSYFNQWKQLMEPKKKLLFYSTLKHTKKEGGKLISFIWFEWYLKDVTEKYL